MARGELIRLDKVFEIFGIYVQIVDTIFVEVPQVLNGSVQQRVKFVRHSPDCKQTRPWSERRTYSQEIYETRPAKMTINTTKTHVVFSASGIPASKIAPGFVMAIPSFRSIFRETLP